MKSNINEQLFFNPNAITSYIMGFLWGDGYLPPKGNAIKLEIVEEDWLIIKPLFDTLGTYSNTKRNSKNGWKPQNKMQFTNFNVKHLLISLNYQKKSFLSHDKAINFIPDKYKFYWIRGLFDADGCIYRHDKQYLRQFSITSTYEQDWQYLHNLLSQNKINSKIELKIHKNRNPIQKHSILRGSGSKNIQNLYQFLYPKGYDGIGLTRKHDKMLGIIQDFC